MKCEGVNLVICLFALMLICSYAHGQESNAEMRAFREELIARNNQTNLSFEGYQKALSKLLDRKPEFNLWQRLLRFFRVPGDGDDLRILNTIFFVIGILALMVAVAFFVQQIRQHLVGDAEGKKPSSTEDSPITARAALNQAERFEANRDFREALRSLYLAALLHLHERRLISYDQSLTNREYLRELKKRPSLQEALRPVIYTFDEVWYGYKPSNEETVATYRGLLQKVYETAH